ncbi:NADH dehydrogenase [ubiquinone] flavoprotein 3, mitochondrial [Varanus komodoensis]|uniref:NADH dehydrogenase [ubiquinone] flavoprotein 3, mitochondrial n=1 Tax=Varanus komodoensis TaxID=61221 RepID=UPI001CF7801A|nr:NADH dehydrogenase [ubiquinone] flavoprotein 3, mitochondrial [Varanus komodoensis]
MAASLLIGSSRVSALKNLPLQAWRLRSLPSVSLGTKPGNTKKGSKQNKGEIISNSKPDSAVQLADEDLRKFFARKTLVAFPQRAKFPSPGAEPAFSSAEGLRKKSTDEESSSSLSSGSDSSSDSEEEDNSFKHTIKAKVFPRKDPISSEDRMKGKGTLEKHFPQEQVKDKTLQNFPSTKTPIKQKQLYQATADDKWARTDLAKHGAEQRPKESHLKSTDLGVKIAESQRPREVSSKQLDVSLPEASSSISSKTQPVLQQSVAQNLTLRQEENVPKELKKTEVQGRTAAVQKEDLNSEVPMVEATVKDESTLDTGIQTEQQSTILEAKPSTETAQETFDIATYKNLQHHEYTPYTFVDYDVLLSKLRLPQPSSGKLSPRH